MDEQAQNSNETMLFCDNIELDDFNQIQPFGVLLVLDFNLKVVHYSENVTALLAVTVDALLSRPITQFLKTLNHQEDLITVLNNENKKYIQMLWQSEQIEVQVLVYISRSGGNLLLEIEHNLEPYFDDVELSNLTQFSIESMKNTMRCYSVAEMAQKTCEEIKKITGYNRVIIYKFDEVDQSGLVIGEVVDQGLEPYIGLRFPASDIPKNVRAMYLEQPLRYIPSNEQSPVKIIPTINSTTNHSFSLNHINLRMVAPVHVRYLKNMKVSAATSVAIIQNDKLWGLIACHNQKEKFLSMNLRLILLLIANTMATQVWALESSMNYSNEQKKVALQSHLTLSFGKKDALLYGLDNYHKVMMDLVSAAGLSHFFQGVLFNYGETPDNEQVIDLVAWLKSKNFPVTYSTSKLPEEYSNSLSYKDKACGLLAIKITAIEDHYLLFYKPEQIQTIQWAGNPDEVLKCNKTSYSPRDSFARFLQTIDNRSAAWEKSDENAENFIRSIVTNWQLQDLLQAQVTHDPLTNLLNRLYLEQRLSLEIKRALRNKRHLSVILADLDYFKNVNDKFGHQAGDVVLIEFSKSLSQSFREYDSIYRFGGEEFLIILPEVDSDDAYQRAEAMREKTKRSMIIYNSVEIFITVSFGISVYPENGIDAKSMIAAADAALYQAKQNGRDQVKLATCSMS